MKKHAIIPIFIPHLGCPNDCVFCNQRRITAKINAVTEDDVMNTINKYMSTLDKDELDCLEISFYGGSFTGLSTLEQNRYLDIAYDMKNRGEIDAIHLSTRPDYISVEILDNLKEHSVDTIELGVQSFDDEVLLKSNRGHTAFDVYRACDLIKEYGFNLGIQLMIGLPGDSRETCIYSANETVKIKPELARLYPTVIIDDTKLLDMYNDGEYVPYSIGESISITKDMYMILDQAGINIMRVGLKSTDFISDETTYGNTYHPAMRQLVESEIAREIIERQIKPSDREITVLSSKRNVSNAAGHNGINRKYFKEKYPDLRISFKSDERIYDNSYVVVR